MSVLYHIVIPFIYLYLCPKVSTAPLAKWDKDFLQAVACGYVLFFGAKKRTKRNIHPHQTSPYIGRLKKFLAETDEKFYVLVSRDFAMIFFIGWRMDWAR